MFSVGDVVMLKSGGPHMTVTNHNEKGVHVVWFSNSETRQEVFPEPVLVLTSNLKMSMTTDFDPFKRHDDI